MYIINSFLSCNQIVSKNNYIITRFKNNYTIACLNRWQNHGGGSIEQAVSFARSVVVAFMSHQRDGDDKLRVRDAASAVDFQYSLQYTYTHLYDQ